MEVQNLTSGQNPYDYVVDFIFQSLITPQMIMIVLFVLVIMEVIKYTYEKSKGKEIGGNILPWILLCVCAIATLLIKEVSISKKFVFDCLLSIGVSDLIYTYGGRKLLKWIIGKFKSETPNVNNQ